MIPCGYDEIDVPTDHAVGLDLTKIDLPPVLDPWNLRLQARIIITLNPIAWLENGDTPTAETAQQLPDGGIITLESYKGIHDFLAVAIGGAAKLAVQYYRGG